MASPAKKSSARIPAQPAEAAKATPAPVAAPAAKAPAPVAAPAAKGSIDARERYQLVAREAYYLAEKRGFAPGREMEDWIAAEKTVAARLAAR
jgi:hypothetical protein